MHNGFITIDKEKMSKSKGNFFTVRDIRKQYSGEEIRFFLLSGQYRGPIDFSPEHMEQSRAGLARITNCADDLDFTIKNGKEGPMTEEEQAAVAGFDQYRQAFIEAMDDDLNTADGITAVFELVTAINTGLRGGATKAYAEAARKTLQEFADILGILQKQEESGIEADVEALVAERQEARKAKNWARADQIRDELKARGYTLKDTPQGVQIIKD